MIDSPPPIFVQTRAMAHLLSLVNRYASYALPFPVLITGQRGTGKTVIARWLHELWCRKMGGTSERPFVAFNAAEVPHEHEMSYLFGHSRGAFTGAAEARKGALERANNGTLFIDEVSALSSLAQQVLLTSLPTGRFSRMGDDRELTVRFRFIAATNVQLDKLEATTFRRDLIDRLGPFILSMPSLAERRDEILPLARGYLRWLAEKDGRGLSYRLSPEAERALLRAPWRGNLRELWHACFHAVVHSDRAVLSFGSFPRTCWDDSSAPSSQPVGDDSIKIALEEADGNRTEAAWTLGISRRTVQRWIKRAADK